MADANLHVIYNHLFLGKKLQMGFKTAKEAEAFRVRLQQYKKSQDVALSVEGIEKQAFSFSVEASLNPEDPSLGPPFLASLEFRDRVSQIYSFTIIEEAESSVEEGNDEQKVSADMGEDKDPRLL